MKASLYRWLKRGKRRRVVMEIMTKPMINSEIERRVKDKLKLKRNSNIPLREFKDKGLIECVNPGVDRGVIYKLTEKGKRYARKLAKKEGRIFVYKESNIDWRIYGWIIFAKRRKKVLQKVSHQEKSIKDIESGTSICHIHLYYSHCS